jgi:hypothetical protein
MTETKNTCLVTALADGLTRNRAILKTLTPEGLSAVLLEHSIRKAREALNSGDVTAMLYAYNDLKENN